MKHRSVAGPAAPEMMPLDETAKSAALTGANDVNPLLGCEDVAENLVSRLWAVFAFDAHFSQHANRRRPRLFEMPGHSLGDPLRLDKLDQVKLDGLVAILVDGFLLHDNARPGLNYSDRNNSPVVLEDLAH